VNQLAESVEVWGGSKVMFISFTKAAATEAISRTGAIPISKNAVCTLHSLMFKLCNLISDAVVDSAKLNQFGTKTGFRFRGNANDMGDDMETGDHYLSVISQALNRQTSLKDEYHESGRPGNWAEFEFFCHSYAAWKHANGYVDFNDMLLRYLEAPEEHGAHAIHVDEAQDLTNLQWKVIDALVSHDTVKQVYVAGDDDQAVFEWAGANPAGMRQFAERYKSKQVVLNQSWRVPRKAHEMALKLISRVKNRVEKEYLPKPSDGEVRRMSSFNPSLIKQVPSVLILCRSFHIKNSVEQELIRHLIPYKNDGGMPGLFDSKIALAVRAFKNLYSIDDISKTDLNRVMAVADDRTKADIRRGDLDAVRKRGYMRSLKIPVHLVDFYRTADLTQVAKVRLSTIHSSKGREADQVILHTGLTMKTLRAIDSNPDAEVRVWYVGLTRTKHYLDILEGDMGYKI
jgi:DNA helicase-2/ATP-dependent DNA helicase PcrA